MSDDTHEYKMVPTRNNPERGNNPAKVPAPALEDLIKKWKTRELHPNATEKERILWGSAIQDLQETIDDYDSTE